MDSTMKRTHSKAITVLAAMAGLAAAVPGCATLQEMANVMVNVQRLKFRVASVNGFAVAGIGIASKQKLTDFTLMDGVNLLASFNGKKLPASFTLNVEAVNPNDGTGGSTQTASTLTSFEWRLLIDDKPTVAGNIEKPIEIPGTGQATTIPLKISLDLMEFFKEKGYNDLLNLALALGGAKSDIARLVVDAQPRAMTPIGEITYPGRITVVSKEYR
jgi:hypothetical protein